MFTDTVGFTASTQSNEGGTLEVLRQQTELLRPLFQLHQGREIKSTGDGFLVEFDSALKAVQCAVNIQRRIYERNSEGVQAPIRIRIGIHLGDVVRSGEDILGDAVNIAARIEPLAEPGGVCVSGAVFEQVRSKVTDRFERLPPQALKGLDAPIEVYQVVLPWSGAGSAESAAVPFTADKSRLAVLPFTNISPDPSDEYFADGLTEELIANLSLVPGLKVIARTSVIGYKKTEKKVAAIGRELEVGTVVEGSVRRAANRIRVTVQVIDVETQEHLWTATYDDDLSDIFAVQREIATKVATALPKGLARLRAQVPELGKPKGTDAYLAYLQGQALIWNPDEPSLRQALQHFQGAIEIDPTFARGYAGLAQAYINLGIEGFLTWSGAIELGKAAAERATKLDPDLPDAHIHLASLAFMADDPIEVQFREVSKALELNPSSAEAHSVLSSLAASYGIIELFVSHEEEAYRLDPLSPPTIRRHGNALLYMGKAEEALAHWKKHLKHAPMDAYRGMAEYYLVRKDFVQADVVVKQLEALAPDSQAALGLRGLLLGLRGDRDAALALIARSSQLLKKGAAGRVAIGYIYYAVGDLDRFFEEMLRAAHEHIIEPVILRFSPIFDAARRDPRFVVLMATAGRPR